MNDRNFDLDDLTLDPDEYPDRQRLPSQLDRIFDRDWDVLVVYDAARYDAMTAVVDAHGYDGDDVEPLRTPSTSSTPDWLYSVWNDDVADWSDLTYVMGNPIFSYVDDEETGERADYRLRDNVGEFVDATESQFWKREESAWDRQLGSSRPGQMAEVGLREDPPLVVHLNQPHVPFVGRIKLSVPAGEHPLVEDVEFPGSTSNAAYGDLVTPEFYRWAYLENLRHAYRKTTSLRNKFIEKGYDVVLTADHGEALGPNGWNHGAPDTDANRVVPWIEL